MKKLISIIWKFTDSYVVCLLLALSLIFTDCRINKIEAKLDNLELSQRLFQKIVNTNSETLTNRAAKTLKDLTYYKKGPTYPSPIITYDKTNYWFNISNRWYKAILVEQQ